MRRTTSNTRSAISSHIANTDQGAPTRCCEWYVKCNFAYGFRTLRVRGASRDPSAAAHAATRLSFLARTAPSVPGELASHARYLFSAAGSALPPPVAGSAGQSPTWTVRRMDSDAGKENLLRGPKSRNRRSFDGLGCVRCPRASGPSARGCQRRSPMANATEHQRGRDARTGRIIPVAEALRRPSTTVVETYKVGKKGPRN